MNAKFIAKHKNLISDNNFCKQIEKIDSWNQSLFHTDSCLDKQKTKDIGRSFFSGSSLYTGAPRDPGTSEKDSCPSTRIQLYATII